MIARVKEDARWLEVRCSGLIFVKTEWRSVLEGREAEAEANPYLETAEGPAADPVLVRRGEYIPRPGAVDAG